QRLQRLRREGDDLAVLGGGGKDDVDATRRGAYLEVRDQRRALLGPELCEAARRNRHEGWGQVGKPASEIDDERLKRAGELLRDRAPLGRLDRAQVLIQQEAFRVVRRQEQRLAQSPGAEDDDDVTRFHARRPGDERVAAIESPVGRFALRLAQGAVLLTPARERGQPQPPRDD